jgi:hypothetical protein
MRKSLIILLFTAALVPPLFAQSLKGTCLNGSTGLYSIPSGRIGWERSSDFGLDFGYHALINENGTAHIPTLTLSLFKWVEISTAFDIQPDVDVWKNGNPPKKETEKNDDLLFGIKLQLPTDAKDSDYPAVAVGSSIQLINIFDDDSKTSLTYRYTAFQFYLATTYAGTFFKMPAETTVVIGKTAYRDGPKNNSNIDFGMGFDLVLFPDAFGTFVHWIIDFANFDYSDNAWPNNLIHGAGPSWQRGILNTGLRIDLASIPPLKKYKLSVDLIFIDLFDDGSRSFSIGAVFGIPLL